jgi:H+/Na+-translocating ferredoxin:NAD+ oxidoreductase subunit D
MLDVRQLWRALHGVPQLLLVQPEQLAYDLAFALALLPLVVAGIVFFLQDAILLFAISFLAGIVCLLALQLARLSIGLPAWVGFKATHPLVASILIACFFSPRTPAWVAATMVILFVVIDTLLWPQLQRVMLHPALIVLGLLFVIQRQLEIGYVNPFDGRRLDDPQLLWYKLRIVIDPVKLYFGNVPGPIGATSAGAVLLGLIYLWYTRKISLGLVAGFLVGVAAVSIAIGSDIGFQLSSGPSLFIAGYLAADRRRVLLPERLALAFGIAAGVVCMILRWYGEGQQAAWQAFLLVSVLVTVALRVRTLLRRRSGQAGRTSLRALAVDSGDPAGRPQFAPLRQEAPQPAVATARAGSAFSRAGVQPVRSFDSASDPNDLVRQMRIAATRGGPLRRRSNSLLLVILALVIVNPIGLVLTWTSPSLNRPTRMLLTGLSLLWYLAAAGLVFALTHR